MNLQLEGNKLVYHLDRLHDWYAGKEIFPLYLEIGPSRTCNQRCVHCYVGHLGFDGVSLEEELSLKLIDDSAKVGVKGIQLAGCGEPLFNKTLPKAVQKAHDYKIAVALTTNGVLFNQRLVEQTLHAFTWVRYSVLGYNRETYGQLHRVNPKQFDVLLKNMSDAIEYRKKHKLGANLGVAMYVFHENALGVLEFAKLMKEIGMDYVQVKSAGSSFPDNDYFGKEMYNREGLATVHADHFKEAERLSNENFAVKVRWDQFEFSDKSSAGIEALDLLEGCLSLDFQCVIDSDGKVYTCNGHWGKEEYCYGDLHKNSFIEIWQSERKKSITRDLARKVNYDECYYPCRHYSSNKFLWDLTHPPLHVNLI